jgi:hypothetical protein
VISDTIRQIAGMWDITMLAANRAVGKVGDFILLSACAASVGVFLWAWAIYMFANSL